MHQVLFFCTVSRPRNNILYYVKKITICHRILQMTSALDALSVHIVDHLQPFFFLKWENKTLKRTNKAQNLSPRSFPYSPGLPPPPHIFLFLDKPTASPNTPPSCFLTLPPFFFLERKGRRGKG